MSSALKTFPILLALLVGPAGCGQSGPLYLPDEEERQEEEETSRAEPAPLA